MDHEAEVIKQHMLETRTDLTRKLEELEEQVAATVRGTTEAVSETVHAVKGAVENTVESVKEKVEGTVETVKETFDIPQQVQKHPWAMMAGFAALGYLGGRLLSSSATCRTSSTRFEAGRSNGRPQRQPFPREESREGAAPATESRSEVWDRLVKTFSPVLTKLSGLAIGVASGVVGKMILESVPESLRGEVENVVNEMTTALGGKPLPQFLHADESEAHTEQTHARW
jgi:ElaB/YqjD/DUF883 family membrane-anchored ribosome-binding protein